MRVKWDFILILALASNHLSVYVAWSQRAPLWFRGEGSSLVAFLGQARNLFYSFGLESLLHCGLMVTA